MRYAVCRRQFSTIDGSKVERKILDYQSHMYKLGPMVGDMIVLALGGKFLSKMHREMDEKIMQDDFKLLDIMHHYTSGFKSLFSQTAYENNDICRQSLGGVGISSHSLLPAIVNDYAPVAVFEGDNTVMAKQNVRYIQKKIKKSVNGKPAKGFFEYLNHFVALCQAKSSARSLEEFLNIDHLDECLAVRAAYWCNRVIPGIAESKESKKRIYNDIFGQDIVSLSKMHMSYLALKIARDQIDTQTFKDPNVKKLLELCVKVWCLNQLHKDSHALYETGFFKPGTGDFIKQGL